MDFIFSKIAARGIFFCLCIPLAHCESNRGIPSRNTISSGKLLLNQTIEQLATASETLCGTSIEYTAVNSLHKIQASMRSFYRGLTDLERQDSEFARRLFLDEKSLRANFGAELRVLNETLARITGCVDNQRKKMDWAKKESYLNLVSEITREILVGWQPNYNAQR